MFRRGSGFVLSLVLLCGVSLHAQTTAKATVQVGCTGKSNATVAIRWGHPDYDQNQYAPLFTVHCNQGVQTETATLWIKRANLRYRQRAASIQPMR